MNILIVLDKKSPEEEYAFRYIFDVLGICAHLNFRCNAKKNINKFDIIIKYSLYKNTIKHKSVIDIFKSNSEIKNPSFVQLKEESSIISSRHEITILKTEYRKAGKKPLFSFSNEKQISAVSYEKNSKGHTIYINFDLIKEIIYFLSLEQEKSLEENGIFINTFFKNIPGNKEYAFQPIINQAIFLIEQIIHFLTTLTKKTIIEKSLYPDYAPCMVCLTHDVDGIKKDIIDRLKHLRHSMVRITHLLRTKKVMFAVQELKLLFIKLFSLADYNQFRTIIEIEKRFNVNSSFNFFAKTRGNQLTFKEYILNPRYDITKKYMQKIFRLLADEGKEIGLHGSYNSYNNEKLLSVEKKLLEKTIKQKVRGGRQHLLRFSTSNTFSIYEKNRMNYDTTYGFRDINGFRAGLCIPFKPFNKTLNRPYSTLEIPLIIMDGVFFDRDVKSKDIIWYETLKILKKIKENHGCGSIVWHNRVFCNTDYPLWSELYLKIIKWAKLEKAILCSPKELLKWFNDRNNLTLKKYKINKNKIEYTLISISEIDSMPITIYTKKKAKITCNHRTKIWNKNSNISVIIYDIKPRKDIKITVQ